MTKEQFGEGINEMFNRGARKVYALIGPQEDDAYIIANNDFDFFKECETGILITHGKTFHYLPFETIIALTGAR